MATKVGVINKALVHLGQPPMAGPSDTSTWVKRVTSVYVETVRSLLEQHPWNFPAERAELARLDEEPVGRDYAYNKPADCLRLNLVNTTGYPDDVSFTDYEDEGGRILADADAIYAFYIGSGWTTKEGSWPQVFADAVSAELASTCAPIVSKSVNKGESLYAKALRALKRAKSFDASQKPWRELPAGKWSRARRTGTRYNTEGH